MTNDVLSKLPARFVAAHRDELLAAADAGGGVVAGVTLDLDGLWLAPVSQVDHEKLDEWRDPELSPLHMAIDWLLDRADYIVERPHTAAEERERRKYYAIQRAIVRREEGFERRRAARKKRQDAIPQSIKIDLWSDDDASSS